MLYQIYEAQRALMSPFSEFASATAKLYEHPMSPFAHTPMAQRISASFDLLHRLAKEYEKPPFNITSATVEGVEVAVQEQVAMHKPFCRLLRFKRFTDQPRALDRMKSQPTVLVVAPLSGHHSTLLRDTVKSLLADHKVYITDWTDARMVPAAAGPFHLSDYVGYIQEFIRHCGEQVHVISVCQPTVPVLAAVSLMASRGERTPLSMTMMGGPIDARKCPTTVNNLATNKSHSWFENNVIFRVPPNYPGAGRRVYPGFMQHTGFVSMNPDRHMTSHYDYFLDLVRGDDSSAESHRQFYDEYNAVLDMPAEYYLDTIKVVFQDFSLVNGTWVVDGKPVRPQDITETALLTVEGELDDISGAGQTRAAHDLCTSIPEGRAFHYDAMGAGHYGIFSGRRWREHVYPQVAKFIARFNTVEAADAVAPALAAPAAASKRRAKAVIETPAQSELAIDLPAAAESAVEAPRKQAAAAPAARKVRPAASAQKSMKPLKSRTASQATATAASEPTKTVKAAKAAKAVPASEPASAPVTVNAAAVEAKLEDQFEEGFKAADVADVVAEEVVAKEVIAETAAAQDSNVDASVNEAASVASPAAQPQLAEVTDISTASRRRSGKAAAKAKSASA